MVRDRRHARPFLSDYDPDSHTALDAGKETCIQSPVVPSLHPRSSVCTSPAWRRTGDYMSRTRHASAPLHSIFSFTISSAKLDQLLIPLGQLWVQKCASRLLQVLEHYIQHRNVVGEFCHCCSDLTERYVGVFICAIPTNSRSRQSFSL